MNTQEVYRFDNCKVDPARQRVRLGDQVIDVRLTAGRWLCHCSQPG